MLYTHLHFTLTPVCAVLSASQELNFLSGGIYPNDIACPHHFRRGSRPPFGDGDPREDGPLNHHRVCYAEHEGFRSYALDFNVVEGPPVGDAAFGRREEEDLVLYVLPLYSMPGTGDLAGPAVEVVPRAEALC